jgi:hypothetical protein
LHRQCIAQGENNMTKNTETTGIVDLNGNLFEQMRDMNRAWLERLRETRQMESEFGSRLLVAKNPAEAAAICNDWMAKRLQSVAAEQQIFTTAWLGLVSHVVRSTSAMALNESERRQEKT